MTLKLIRVGIVGTGFMANAVHLPTLISLESVKIVALCDSYKKNLLRTANKYPARNIYSDHEEMLKKEKLDCVFCLTDPKTHAEIVKDCLEDGVNVFCEKPLAWTIQEDKEIIRTSEKSGHWVQVGYNRRFTPVYRKAKSVFRTRKVASCVAEKTYEICSPPQYFLRIGLIHAIDILNWFCGEALQVQLDAFKVDSDKLRTVSVLVRYEAGAIALLMGDHSGGAWMEKLEVYGDGCTVLVEAPFRVSICSKGKREMYEPSATYYYPWQKLFGYQGEDEYFINCLRKDTPPSPSAKDDLKTLLFINEMRKKLGLEPL